MRSERPYLRLIRPDLRPERSELRPGRLNLRLGRPDLRLDRPNLRLERPDRGVGGQMNKWMNGRIKVHVCSTRLHPLQGHCPKTFINSQIQARHSPT